MPFTILPFQTHSEIKTDPAIDAIQRIGISKRPLSNNSKKLRWLWGILVGLYGIIFGMTYMYSKDTEMVLMYFFVSLYFMVPAILGISFLVSLDSHRVWS